MFEEFQLSSAETYVCGSIPVKGQIEKGSIVQIINGLQVLQDEITNHRYCFYMQIFMNDYENDPTKIEVTKPKFPIVNHEDVEGLKFQTNFSVINSEEVDSVVINLTFNAKSKKSEDNLKIRKELDLHFDTYKTYLQLESYEGFEGCIEIKLRPGKVPVSNTYINLDCTNDSVNWNWNT